MSGESRRTSRARRPELSQHFLRDGALAARLVALARIGPRDHVVEIGPGTGRLTVALQPRCRRLVAVEVDPRLVATLRRRFADRSNVEIRAGDFLEFPLPEGPYKAIGNVPFARTTALVKRLTRSPRAPSDAHLVVQREAALRFAGAPWGTETLQSLLLKPWWQVEVSQQIPRRHFLPPPSVDCALLWLARRERPLVADAEADLWRSFVRRTLAGPPRFDRAVSADLTRQQARRLARELHFDLRTPPSALRFEQWLAVFRFVARTALPSGRDDRSGRSA